MEDGVMNEWLADFYGTNEYVGGEDLEKSAQAALLEKLAEEDDLDIDSLSDDEVLELAEALGIEGEGEVEGAGPVQHMSDQEKVSTIAKVAESADIDLDTLTEEEFNNFAEYVLSVQAEGAAGVEADLSDQEKISMITKVAEQNEIDIDQLNEDEFNELAAFALDPSNWTDEEEVKEAEAKFAEADFLGRVMAHAQFSELQKISSEQYLEKDAGRADAAKARVLEMIAAAKAKGGAAAEAARGRAAQATEAVRGGADRARGAVDKARGAASSRWAGLSDRQKAAILAGGGGAAGGGAGFAAGRATS